LGIGDWELGPIPNPQSPIPQSPIPIDYKNLIKILKKIYNYINNLLILNILLFFNNNKN